MELLISQKDKIFQIIQSSNFFSPNQFKIVVARYKTETQIKLQSSKYYFNIRSEDKTGGFEIERSPAKDRLLITISILNWSTVVEQFTEWIENLEREIKSPNLWDKFESNLFGFEIQPDLDNSKFTAKEFEQLSLKMKLLIQNVETLNLLNNEKNEIQNSLQHLLELSKDLGKFDWKSVFVGTIISIIIQLNVNKENADALWKLIKQAFNTYFIK